MKTKRKNMKKKNFTRKDYNSKDGMLTRVWGPSLWHVLHTISFNYPVEPTYKDKVNYRKFIFQMKYILPCGKCRDNFKNNLKQLPLKMSNMENRETFSKYVYELHEVINKMLKKKSNLTYFDVRDRYENFRARCKTQKPKSEIGCVKPLRGEKKKCVLKIVPDDENCESFQMN
tara:strand:+ start:125 stop:643 length:519 start_codon:yes stop_codon:yes gene_type:complete